MKKIIAIILSLVLALSLLAACGSKGGSDNTGSDNTGEKVETVPGEIKSWGQFTEVLVPEGFAYSEGSLIEETDENTVRMNSEADWKFNITLSVGEAGDGEDHVENNRYFNSKYEITDVSEYKTGDYTWKGISFTDPEDGTWTSYALYTTLEDGRDVKAVMSVTTGNDDIAQAVLASMKIAPAA